MTRRDHKAVRERVRDLLAESSSRRVDPVGTPAGELPAGVAARLALLVAIGEDPGILSRARYSPEQRAARKALLDDAVASGRTIDLRATVTLPVRCRTRVHQVRLGADGTVVPLAHPDADLESERVFASLGGTLLPCLLAVEEAGCYWPPPVADDGPRCGAIEAGELLAFVARCRTWLATGRELIDCGTALEMGIEPAKVEGHLAAAGSGKWLTRWARVAGGGLTIDELAEWAAFGLPVGVWGETASRGFRAADVPMWTSAGFSPVEVLRFAHLRVPLHEAIAWRDERFTAYVATSYLGVGITLADACALRGLPVREVQEAWPRCGSVAAVRELLAS